MESQSQQKFVSFPLCASNSNHLFLVTKRYPVRAKPVNGFSIQTNDVNLEDDNNSFERIPTEDTISETKENREEVRSTLSPDNRRGSSLFNSLPNSPSGGFIKPILKSPKIGTYNKRSDFHSAMQSFLDSNLDQLDSDEILFGEKEEPKIPSNQSTPRRKVHIISRVGHSSLNTTPVKPSKKVTFATRLVEFQKPLQLVEPSIKILNVSSLSPSKPAIKLNIFSAEEITQNCNKDRRPLRRSSLVPNIGSGLQSKEQEFTLADSPIFNLKNRPTHAISNMKLPLVLTNTKGLKSFQIVPVPSDDNKTSVAPQVARRHSCPVGLPKN